MPLAFLMNMTPMELFKYGGPIMWPILLTSLLSLTVVIERVIFIIRENSQRDQAAIEQMLEKVESRDIEGAMEIGRKTKDFVARILVYALSHREHSLANAFVRASNQELNRYKQGLTILDTVITASLLLGLLGTVTGMMETFGALGAGGDIAANAARVMAGVGEALIAVMTGLAITIITLVPFNYLNARMEEARHEVEDASNSLEIIINKQESTVRS
ncbi:MAG: MotA/TolQ/ExbB proton channel family protein [Candidatus Didemnitutus sp.]|jgi:biopolymer transport protein ExbB|nr:MotA/TolQ/ExbB proton channel family protein [Candidatus Didemnitutus sp.]